jgi:type II secretory pathway pseudopilin PulG
VVVVLAGAATVVVVVGVVVVVLGIGVVVLVPVSAVVVVTVEEVVTGAAAAAVRSSRLVGRTGEDSDERSSRSKSTNRSGEAGGRKAVGDRVVDVPSATGGRTRPVGGTSERPKNAPADTSINTGKVTASVSQPARRIGILCSSASSRSVATGGRDRFSATDRGY